MISVKSKGKQSKLLTQFKSLVNAEGTLETYKSKRYYAFALSQKEIEEAAEQRAKISLMRLKRLKNIGMIYFNERIICPNFIRKL